MKDLEFIACSGADYNGELARQVAIRLCENSPIQDNSSLFCFTIFLKNCMLKDKKAFETMKQQLTSSSIIVIDGCSGGCVFKLLNFLKIKPDLVINLQKLVPKEKINPNDISSFKRPNLAHVREEDIEKVSNYIMEQLKEKNLIDLE